MDVDVDVDKDMDVDEDMDIDVDVDVDVDVCSEASRGPLWVPRESPGGSFGGPLGVS